jgi:hypothetical protein
MASSRYLREGNVHSILDGRTLVRMRNLHDKGKSHAEIAFMLDVSENTVRYHMDAEFRKSQFPDTWDIGEIEDVFLTYGMGEAPAGGLHIPGDTTPQVTISDDNPSGRIILYMYGRDMTLKLTSIEYGCRDHLAREGVGTYGLRSRIVSLMHLGLVQKTGGTNINRYALTERGKSLAEKIAPGMNVTYAG